VRPQGRAIERRYKISAKDARIITVVAVDCCVKRPSPPPAELPERYRTDYDDEQRPPPPVRKVVALLAWTKRKLPWQLCFPLAGAKSDACGGACASVHRP